LAIIEAAPFAVDLAAAFSSLERTSITEFGETYWQRFKGKAPVSQKAFERLDELV
jgi:hypothetical protein